MTRESTASASRKNENSQIGQLSPRRFQTWLLRLCRCVIMSLTMPIFLCLLASARGLASCSDFNRPAPESASAVRARILIVVGGHEFDTAGFAAMFQKMAGISNEVVWFGQGAEHRLTARGARDFDAIVFYDMHQHPEPHWTGMLQLLKQGK